MPGGFVSKETKIDQLATQIATIQDTTFPMADHRAPPDALHVPVRGDYRRHEMVGLNVFVESMFGQFDAILGVDKVDPMTYARNGNSLAIDNMVRQAREATVDLAVALVDVPVQGPLVAEVIVTNKVGHRFPSGVGFRRAFLEVVARKKSTGEVVWGSGRTNSVGVIVDGKGEPLPSEFLPNEQTFQPHYLEVRGEDQVQIYEELTLNARREFNTSFIHRVTHVKNNRLLARGWLSRETSRAVATSSSSSWSRPTPTGKPPSPIPTSATTAARGPRGSDRIRYVMSLPAGVDNADVAVTATMYYQSIPPYFLAQRFKLAPKGEATRRLYYLASHLVTEGHAHRGLEAPARHRDDP